MRRSSLFFTMILSFSQQQQATGTAKVGEAGLREVDGSPEREAIPHYPKQAG
jgi:hypothetical protein